MTSTWSICGVANLVAVVLLGGWVASDPLFSGVSSDDCSHLSLSALSFWEQIGQLHGARRIAMVCLLGLVGSCLGIWCLAILIGRSSDRSIRSWLAITGAVALWLSFLGNWHEIGWLGKQWRATNYVESFKPIAEDLKANWPCQEGEHAKLGMFQAYPTGRPRSVLLMSCPSMVGKQPTFNGVERTADNGIAFPMVGADGGDWLEWHPTTGKPGSYRTGLQQDLKLRRAAALKDGWFLVRYCR